MKYIPRLPDSSVNYSHEPPLRELFRLLLALTAIIVSIFFILGFAVERIVPHVPPAFEEQIGNLYLQSIDLPDSNDQRLPYLQKLTQRISDSCALLSQPVQVFLVYDEQINAVALPGGKILIFEGLLKQIESENELAFIIGHEIGHFVQKDHLRALGRNLVILSIGMALFGADNQLNRFLSQSLQLSQIGYSRKQESGADSIGLKALNCHYGHVGGATDFFKKLQEDHPHSRIEAFISTHPAHQKRIREVEHLAKTKGWSISETKPLPDYFNQD